MRKIVIKQITVQVIICNYAECCERVTACSEYSVNKSKYLLSAYYMLGAIPGRELSASAPLDEEWRHFHGILFQIRVEVNKVIFV